MWFQTGGKGTTKKIIKLFVEKPKRIILWLTGWANGYPIFGSIQRKQNHFANAVYSPSYPNGWSYLCPSLTLSIVDIYPFVAVSYMSLYVPVYPLPNNFQIQNTNSVLMFIRLYLLCCIAVWLCLHFGNGNFLSSSTIFSPFSFRISWVLRHSHWNRLFSYSLIVRSKSFWYLFALSVCHHLFKNINN